MTHRSKAELTTWAKTAEYLWLFLDYDGTLDTFASSPFDVHPNPEIIQILKDLAADPAIRITILSGRNLEHLRQLVPVHGIFLAGSYGVELLTPERETIYRLQFDELRPVLEGIKPHWNQLISGRRGFFLEDKGWTLAIHARFANDEEAAQVIEDAQNIHGSSLLLQQFRLVGGHKFLELAPQLASKREAVLHLLHTYPVENARFLYVGDDDKDEEAFPVIHDHGGLVVKVRQPSQLSQPSEADFFFADPGETLDWLKQLIR